MLSPSMMPLPTASPISGSTTMDGRTTERLSGLNGVGGPVLTSSSMMRTNGSVSYATGFIITCVCRGTNHTWKMNKRILQQRINIRKHHHSLYSIASFITYHLFDVTRLLHVYSTRRPLTDWLTAHTLRTHCQLQRCLQRFIYPV